MEGVIRTEYEVQKAYSEGAYILAEFDSRADAVPVVAGLETLIHMLQIADESGETMLRQPLSDDSPTPVLVTVGWVGK